MKTTEHTEYTEKPVFVKRLATPVSYSVYRQTLNETGIEKRMTINVNSVLSVTSVVKNKNCSLMADKRR